MDEKKFADLKARLEKYFHSVPPQLWFAGKAGAVLSRERQIRIMQAMFGIDCTDCGGGPVPQGDGIYRTYTRSQVFHVAVGRLEAWETRQKIAAQKVPVEISTTIEQLDLSARAYNGLLNAGITHVNQLLECSGTELLRMRNFGRKSLNEVKVCLAAGFRLKGDHDR